MTAVVAGAAANELELLYLGLGLITPHPQNRKRFDEAKLAELAESLKVRQITPATVRPFGEGYQLIAGERRWRAMQLAGLPTLLCLVREMDDTEALEVLAIENNQREDPHPMEEAELYRELLQRGYDVAKIAAKLHRSVSYVYDRLKLLQLVPRAQQLFLDGVITLGHAIHLARIPAASQDLVIGTEDDQYHDGDLFIHEKSLFTNADVDAEDSDPLQGKKPISVKELQAWIDEHVRFDLEAPDPMLFPETAAAIAQAHEEGRKVVPITEAHYVQPDAREGAKIVSPKSWARADGLEGSKACDYAELGVNVAGAGRSQHFKVCVAKTKCAIHWPEQVARAKAKKAELDTAIAKSAKAGDTAADRERKAKEAQAAQVAAEQAEQAERDRWDKAGPLILKLALEKLKKAPAGAEGPAGRMLREIWDDVGYGPRKGCLPMGKSADDLVRHLASLQLVTIFGDDWNCEERWAATLKPLGLDVRSLVDQLAPKPKPPAPTKAEAKPAKKLAGDVRRSKAAKKKATR